MRDITTARSPFEPVKVKSVSPFTRLRGIRRPTRLSPDRGGRSARRPIRSRRVLSGYALEDPLEARAVPKSTFRGSILERIVYKRNLFLFGAPSPRTWSAQRDELGGKNTVGGIAIDFVYFLSQPLLALEVQGAFWHGPGEAYHDASRAFIVQSFGYRYAELLEQDIVSLPDPELDRLILDAVGGTVPPWNEQWLTHARPRMSVGRVLSRKEGKRF